MKRMHWWVLAALLPFSVARAQQLPPAADSVIVRAQQLATSGDSASARRLLDSLISARDVTPIVSGEATYWLSRLAPSNADRERLLGALIVDHAFSPRVPAALYELGMLELERNDRDRAATHLARFLSSAPGDTARVTVSLALGKLLIERNELPRACAVLLVGRSEVPEASIELRNQFDFTTSRCQGVDTTARAEKPAADTLPAPRRTGAFTVQVAAYETKSAADKLATTLRGRGLEARVVGTAKPFRVRVGRYATRAEAEEASREIDSVSKSKSIVVVVGPEEP